MSLTAMKIPFKNYLAITKTSKNKLYHFYPNHHFHFFYFSLPMFLIRFLMHVWLLTLYILSNREGMKFKRQPNWFKQIGSMLYLLLVLSNKWLTVLHNLFGIFILVISAWNILAKIVNVKRKYEYKYNIAKGTLKDWNRIRGINCLRIFLLKKM